jgi:hypothetical protein
VLEELVAAEDEDTLARILSTIRHVAAYGGHPHEPTSRRLKGIDLCEIRSKYHHEELIRIYYFTDKGAGKMFLLNSIIKPDGSTSASRYDGKSRKKIEKEIQASIAIAATLKTHYPSTHPSYELLPL